MQLGKDNDAKTKDSQKLYNKHNFKNHLELMSLQLPPIELQEFEQTYEIEKKLDKKMYYLFPILMVIILGSIVVIPSILFNLSKFGEIAVIILSVLSILFIIRFTLFRNFPFASPLDYTWYNFLVDRSIEVERSFLNNSDLYLKAKSYIKKVIPENSHYLSAMYSEEELTLLEKSDDPHIENLRKKIMHPILWDWSLLDQSIHHYPRLNEKIPPVRKIWKILIFLHFILILIAGYYIFSNLLNDPEKADLGIILLFTIVSLQLVFMIPVFIQKEKRQQMRYSPDVIREVLRDRNISVPENQLYITLQNYLEENFPYAEI